MYWSDLQEIDPTADYEVRLSIYSAHPDATGTRYLGVYVYDANQTLLSVTLFDANARNWGTATSNPYFWTGDVYGDNWRDMVAYLIGCNTADGDILAGKNVSRHFKLPTNAKYVRVRFLNYYNSGVTVRNDFFSPSLVRTQLANTDLEYEYDKAGRLTSAQHWAASGVVTTTYKYDLAGNRIEETCGGVTIPYQHDIGNYLLWRGNAYNTYGWGTYGQLVSKVRDSVGYNYNYDDRRLLKEVKVAGQVVGTYTYDAAGRRVKAIEGDVSTVTLYQGNDVIYEIRGLGIAVIDQIHSTEWEVCGQAH
jgi:YD repeat-containing protein